VHRYRCAFPTHPTGAMDGLGEDLSSTRSIELMGDLFPIMQTPRRIRRRGSTKVLRRPPAFITLVVLAILLVAGAGCDGGGQGQTQTASPKTDQTTGSTMPQTTATESEATEQTTTTAVGEEEAAADNTPSYPTPEPPNQIPKDSPEAGPSEEIAVTGVVTSQGTKADGTPVYGIKDEATQKGYFLEGAADFRAYLGQRVTAYGAPRSGGGARVLDVSRVEARPSP
jgi:hypothetical protein